jgi:hypothetical protein
MKLETYSYLFLRVFPEVSGQAGQENYSRIKTLIFTALILLFFNPDAFGQFPTFEWAYAWESHSGVQNGEKVLKDTNGDIFILGNFQDTLDFDPSNNVNIITPNGGKDIYISKWDTDGNMIWTKTIGDIYFDEIDDALIDAQGNLIISGYFRGTVDFDPSSSVFTLYGPPTKANAFILKLDNNGAFIWVGNIGYDCSPLNLALATTGNIFVAGGFYGLFGNDFDPGVGNTNTQKASTRDLFLLKLDSNGVFQWVKTIGSSNSSGKSRYEAMTIDNQDNLYLTGTFDETMDFDFSTGVSTLTNNNNNNDIFIEKLDSSGNLIWVKGIGDTENDIVRGIALDQFGNVYTYGRFKNALDFDPGPNAFFFTSNGNYDIFLQKLDNNGDFQWAKTYGGINGDYGNTLTIDTINNGIYNGGSFRGTVDFNPNIGVFNMTPVGFASDGFLQKLDYNGNFEWALRLAGDNNNSSCGILDILTDSLNNIYTTGIFSDVVDLNPRSPIYNLGSNSSFSTIFFQKLGVPQSNDLGIMTIEKGDCVSNDIVVTVESLSLNPIDSFKVFVAIDGIVQDSLWHNSTITNPDTIQWIPNTVAFQSGQTYTIEAWTALPNGLVDAVTDNDTLSVTLTMDIDIFNFIDTICYGQTFPFIGQNVDTTGTYSATYTNALGCPVTANLDLTVFPEIATTVNDTMCANSIYIYHNFSTSLSGTFTINLSAYNGCDSVITLNLAQRQPNETNISQTICFGETFDFNGTSVALSGTYTDTLAGYNICDSVVILTLTELNPNTTTFSASICDGGVYDFNGTVLTSSGTYTDSLTSFNGCDSIVTLNLTLPSPIDLLDSTVQEIIENVSLGSVTITPTGGFTPYLFLWSNGTTSQNLTNIQTSGTYTVTITDALGCTNTFSFTIGLVNSQNIALLEQVQLYPNPVSKTDKLILDFDLKSSKNIIFQITDISGKLISTEQEIIPQGNYTLRLNAPNTQGIYFVRLLIDGEVVKWFRVLVE